MAKEMDADLYEQGYRAAVLSTLRNCLQELDTSDLESEKVRWVVERELAVAKLRQICEEHGDNDWPNNLNLADVIEKHLWRHLEEKEQTQ